MLTWIFIFLFGFSILSYHRASLSVFTISFGVLLLFATYFSVQHVFLIIVLWAIYIGIFSILNIRPLRRLLLSRSFFTLYKNIMPKLSATEEEALIAGTGGWANELFSGKPNWDHLQQIKIKELSAEERAFLEGPTEELCRMLNNWEISRRMEIPQEVWNFLKTNGFFGLIIPKHFGGLEFSATAHSQILVKVAGVSVAVATVIAVPNSLGPAELLLHYGTPEQKNYFLPRLAKGEEIPCFALTSPTAGSDAGAISDYGIVCKKIINDKEEIYIRLNWNKRYITLAPVATLLGLAFKLYDPDHLLGSQEALGITCALIPVHTDGVSIGRRHYPLDCAFPNGPTQGHDVYVPIDFIIGGAQMAGSGWRMLMECLAAGRSISLPSMATGGARKAALASGAYAMIREQFHLPIGKFGGIQEALARIVTNTYMMDALRQFTVSALDQDQRSAVASAISKYHTTELSRHILTDTMDIHGGKAICMGPNNYLAQGYIEQPICITVEGANILTRSMIIFGQGVIRCHPYILSELKAAKQNDLVEFDKSLFAHIGLLISNKIRSFWLGLTNGIFVYAKKNNLKRMYQKLTRFSAAFAFTADYCMITLGSALKRKEQLSARLADILSYLYMLSAVIKYYEFGPQTAESEQEKLLLQWIEDYLCYKIEDSFCELFANLPRWYLRFIRIVVLPLGRRCSKPSDYLSQKVANLLSEPGQMRERFKRDIYYSAADNDPISKMDELLFRLIAAKPLEQKVFNAEKMRMVKGYTYEQTINDCLAKNILTMEEAELLITLQKERLKFINVDDFAADLSKFTNLRAAETSTIT